MARNLKPTGQPDTARSAVRRGDTTVLRVSASTGRITVAGPTSVEPGDEWLYASDVARLLNINAGTWRTYVSRGQAPQADDPDLDRPAGRRSPRWKRTTIDAWRERRPGQGWHGSHERNGGNE